MTAKQPERIESRQLFAGEDTFCKRTDSGTGSFRVQSFLPLWRNIQRTIATPLVAGIVLLVLIPAGRARAQTVLFFENFDGVSSGCRVDSVLTGWQVADGGDCPTPTGKCSGGMDTTVWTISTASLPGILDGNVAGLYSTTSSCFNLDTLITPVINIPRGFSPFLRFNHKFFVSPGSFGFAIIEGFDGTDWNVIDQFDIWSTGSDSGTKEYYVGWLANPNFRVRFIYYTSDTTHWLIDSIQVYGYCGAPWVWQLKQECPDGIKIIWWPYLGDSIAIEYGPAGFTVGSGTRIVIRTPTTTTDTLIRGFTTNTYDIYIWGWCSGIPSDTNTYSFAFPSIPYLEAFDWGLPWGWDFYGGGLITNCSGLYTDNKLMLEGWDSAYAITPCIATGGMSAVKVSFLYRESDGTSCGGTNPGAEDTLLVLWKVDGTSTWDTLWQTDGGGNIYNFTRVDTILSLPAGAQTIQLKFMLIAGADGETGSWLFDSVIMVVPIPCDVGVAALSAQPDTFCWLDSIIISGLVYNAGEQNVTIPVLLIVSDSDSLLLGTFNLTASDTDTVAVMIPATGTPPTMPGGTYRIRWLMTAPTPPCDTSPGNNTARDSNYFRHITIDSIVAPEVVTAHTDTVVSAIVSGIPDSVVWAFSGSANPTATGTGPHSVHWMSPGTYTIYVRAYCHSYTAVDSGVIVVVAPTGTPGSPIPHQSSSSLTALYSPATHMLAVHINGKEGTTYSLLIRDIAGKMLIRIDDLKAGVWHLLSVANLPQGLILLEVRENNTGAITGVGRFLH